MVYANRELCIKTSSILIILSFVLTSCSNFSNFRGLASSGRDLNGTILGVVKYEKEVRRPKYVAGKRRGTEMVTKKKYKASRLYMHEIESEPGSYHAVVLEYVNLLKMAPKYIASNKMPWLARKIGFLNAITDRITVYKVTPTDDVNSYEMQKLKVEGSEIVADKSEEPSYLVLAPESADKGPLEGATITAAAGGEPTELYFPMLENDDKYGAQYALATFTYKKAKLESTWRKEFLPGPYLGAYGDKRDLVLDLDKASENTAQFIINPDRAHLSDKKRENQLTNPKSAHIEGSYTVTEPADGMFIFNPVTEGQPGAEYVKGRIGLFIDVFDATVSLNQDVVELVLVDSEFPDDFLMYYEHPDNGEGELK